MKVGGPFVAVRTRMVLSRMTTVAVQGSLPVKVK